MLDNFKHRSLSISRLFHHFCTASMASNVEKQPLIPPKNLQAPINGGFFDQAAKTASPRTFLLTSDVVGSNRTLQRRAPISWNFEPTVKNIATLWGGYLGVSSLCFLIFRDDIQGTKTNPIIDAVYFSAVTMTTVGYGDLLPKTSFVKLLACAFIFTGVAIFGLILNKAADYLVEKQEIMLVEAINNINNAKTNQKQKPTKETDHQTISNSNRSVTARKCFIAMGGLSGLMVVGTLVLLTVEKMHMVDSLYCVFSTVTTLGFGDESFSTGTGRFFGIFWILSSTLGLVQVFFNFAEMFVEKRQQELVKWVVATRTADLDLEAPDFHKADVVGAAEFVLYKLKENGKIKEEDMSVVMEEFEKGDFDE